MSSSSLALNFIRVVSKLKCQLFSSVTPVAVGVVQSMDWQGLELKHPAAIDLDPDCAREPLCAISEHGGVQRYCAVSLSQKGRDGFILQQLLQGDIHFLLDCWLKAV